MKRLFASLLTILLAGCVSITIQAPQAPTAAAGEGTPTATAYVPLGEVHPTETPYIEQGYINPTVTPDVPQGDIFPTPTPDMPEPMVDLTAIAPADSAPRSLYFLAQNALWVIRPNSQKAVRLTAEDMVVTAFDAWQGGGRLAFATKSGKLYTQMAGKAAMLLIKLENAPYPAYINGIDWSPDGSQLAFTVTYDNGGNGVYAAYPSRPSGVWITPIQGGKPTWLMSNHYPLSAGAPASDYRRFSEPEWSPDGQGLIVHASYWEWTNTHWIYPLQYAEDDRNLHTLKLPDGSGGNAGSTWGHAAWTPDSQGLVFSSQENVTFGDLAYTNREGTQAELWQAGNMANLYIAAAHMVPSESFLPGQTAGITAGPGRLVYIGDCPVCQTPPSNRLHVMRSKLIDNSMNGSIVGPQSLCIRKDSFGNPNSPRAIEWNPDYSFGVLTCGSNEIYLIDMNVYEPMEFDILSALPQLSPQELPVFRWGEIAQ